jgi:hypothetical protein
VLWLLGARVAFPGVSPEPALLRLASGLRVDLIFGAPAEPDAAAAVVLDNAASPAEVAPFTRVGAPVFLLRTDLAKWGSDARFASPRGAPDAPGAVLVRR